MRILILAFCVAVLAFPSSVEAQQQGRWLRLESPGFVVYTTGSEQRARGVIQTLEAFDGLLRRMTGAPADRSPTKLDIFLLNSDQFAEASGARGSIVGVYWARPDQIAAYAIYTDRSGLGAQDVLFHEYAHHFMYQYFNNAYPAWYSEGFAEVVAPTVMGTQRIVLGRASDGRVRDLLSGNWLPMERLISASPHRLSGGDRSMFYAQSWLFAHYILTQNKAAEFQAYVLAMRQGAEADAALQSGFGVTPGRMESELRQYLRGSPNAIALTRPARAEEVQVSVSRLAPSADRLLPIAARLRRGVGGEAAPEVLSRVRELAGAQPSDRFALLTLARAEATLGDRVRARALLEPHLEQNAEDVEALYLMGRSYLEEAENAEGDSRMELLSQARRYFARAYRVDPNHTPTLYRYAQAYNGVMMDGPTFENYLNVLLLARQLAPQVDEISINAASALMGNNRHAEAIPILRALAYDPHAGGNADAAQRMLNEAQAALGQAAAPER